MAGTGSNEVVIGSRMGCSVSLGYFDLGTGGALDFDFLSFLRGSSFFLTFFWSGFFFLAAVDLESFLSDFLEDLIVDFDAALLSLFIDKGDI